MDFVEIFNIILDLSITCFSHFSVLSFLYVYSDHSILECYNLFSGVELSMRSFFVIGETPELFHYDYFKLEDGELYYRGSRKPLTTEGKLKSVGMLAYIVGKNRLRRLGFNIPVGKVTARQAVMLNKSAEELPSESDIAKADDIELQEIVEKALGIISQIKDVQTDTEDLFEHPL